MNQNGSIGKNPLFWVGVAALIVLSVLCAVDIHSLLGKMNDALSLSSVIMVGLSLVVVLMILLIVFCKVTGIDDKTQALGLPVGSIRALIAFSLVLMFVCIGVFLYEGVSAPDSGKTARGLTQEEVKKFQARFDIVTVEPIPATPTSPNSDIGNSAPKTPGSSPSPDQEKSKEASPQLFNITYYPNRSKDADDFAKQMFAQLATVFVTVIGFYFGSSTATAGVGAGIKAANDAAGANPSPVAGGLPSALQDVKALAHDADADLLRAQNALSSLQKASPVDQNKVDAAQKALDDSKSTIGTLHTKVDAAIAAAAKFGTASTEAENNEAAADVIKARDEIKALAATVRANADKVEALLK